MNEPAGEEPVAGREEVKVIVERRWLDDDGDPLEFEQAESSWVESRRVEMLSDSILGVLVRELLDRTKVDPE